MKPSPDYERLTLAAKTKRGWSGDAMIAAKLTENGYSVSVQTIGNWKKRGISKEGLLKASEIIEVRSAWLETGKGDMDDVGTKNRNKAKQDLPTYALGLTQEESQLIDSYRLKPRHDQLNVLKLLDIEPADFAQSA